MDIGKRIKTRRLELGITQDELAKRLGYKSKTTINKIESGINDITQTKVSDFARILETTPAHLMGWGNLIDMTIGQRIKILRKQKGISADILADKINVSRTTMFRYESGEIKKIPADHLNLISDVLSTTPAYLMGRSFNDSLSNINIELSEQYNKLNEIGRSKVLDYIKDISCNPENLK